MHKHLTVKKLLVVFILALLLVIAALPTFAQDATAEPTAEATTEATVEAAPATEATAEITAAAEATSEATAEVTVEANAEAAPTDDGAAGLPTLFLLIGVGAVLLIGGAMYLRDRSGTSGS